MRYVTLAWSALLGLALLGHAQADSGDLDVVQPDQIVDLMIDQAGTRCIAFGTSWGETPPHWWTPLLSSAGSGKVLNGAGSSSIYG
jgi:hypothetical protein